MHTVEKTDTYTSKDGSKSTYLVAGDQISDEDAAEYGLISTKEADKAAAEGKSAGPAPENKAR